MSSADGAKQGQKPQAHVVGLGFARVAAKPRVANRRSVTGKGFTMWLSGQHKRPADCGEGQTGIVTMSGSETAVQLDCERRGLELYAPAGYRWTPAVGQRVLVIQGQGEIPCIVGIRQDGTQPDSVEIRAKTMEVGGQDVFVRAEEDAIVAGKTVDLQGEVLINGEPLEELIARIVAMLLGG